MEYSSQAVQVHLAARPGVLIGVALYLAVRSGVLIELHLEFTWSSLGERALGVHWNLLRKFK